MPALSSNAQTAPGSQTSGMHGCPTAETLKHAAMPMRPNAFSVETDWQITRWLSAHDMPGAPHWK